MEIDLSYKTVIVTGGTRGIGAAIVKLFHDYNAEVIATGTNIKELDRLNQESSGSKINYQYLDLTSNQSIQSFLGSLNNKNGIDILVNNAGVNRIDSISDIDENDWDWINTVNLRGPFLLTQTVSKIMQDQGHGRIVNIGSIFGIVSKAKRAAYSTTKWGLIGFTKAVALDLAPYNVLVNTVSPGFVNTELTKKILGEKGIKQIVDTIPQKRLANVEEIAKTVIFLCSEHNTYITGQNITVDGGFTSA